MAIAAHGREAGGQHSAALYKKPGRNTHSLNNLCNCVTDSDKM